MKIDSNQTYDQLKHFSQSNRLQFLTALKRLNFSGQLIWATPQKKQWIVLFHRGRTVYATGGVDAGRRWHRFLQSRDADLAQEFDSLNFDHSSSDDLTFLALKEYELLCEWISQKRILAEDCHTFFEKSITEVLFDVVQADQVTHELYRQASLPIKQVLFEIDEEFIINTVKELWQYWLAAGLTTFYPFLAPVIKQPEQMRSALSTQAYQGLTSILDGKHSLRDLAAKTQREPLQFAQALQPYIQAGWIDLIEIADHSAALKAPQSKQVNTRPQVPLIACIDDSPLICQSMGQVIKAAKYDFISVTDAARAINTLLTKRPNLIFLDLIMPGTNGYEICGQLRKVSLFKETPIIILSGNDGLVDQVRARLLGATDFLSKPIEPVVILNIIQKHLDQVAVV